MSIVQNTKKKVGEYLLLREYEKISRKVKAVNFNEAAQIALLFDATLPEEFETVKKYIRRLKDEKRRVKALGFYDAREQPVLMSSKLEYDFFTRKQLKWYLKPEDPLIENFMKEPFDLFINLCSTHKMPLLYVTAFSQAGFKVGRHHPKYNRFYDLIIKVPPDTSLKTYLAEAEKYLQMIHTP